jgi:HAD superfamily hydrolase (TIGR01490 family)
MEFNSLIDKILRPKAMEALKLHKKNGDKIVIISASIENWIKPWAEKADVHTLLATKIEKNESDVLTGRFLTKNCYGREKVNRLLAEFPNRSEYRLVAYGDSRGDRELIDFADEGYYNKFK